MKTHQMQSHEFIGSMFDVLGSPGICTVYEDWKKHKLHCTDCQPDEKEPCFLGIIILSKLKEEVEKSKCHSWTNSDLL